ncbi:MAG: hypothetical protein IKD76_00185 [Clostridia bacterium]|nr:hypothetical protein [Clostridia bacterium]
MKVLVRLYSVLPNEIEKFLSNFYGDNCIVQDEKNCKQWQKEYQNPIEIVDIIGVYIENLENYNLTMWVSVDSGVFIKVTEDNADELIRYLYERFPY